MITVNTVEVMAAPFKHLLEICYKTSKEFNDYNRVLSMIKKLYMVLYS